MKVGSWIIIFQHIKLGVEPFVTVAGVVSSGVVGSGIGGAGEVVTNITTGVILVGSSHCSPAADTMTKLPMSSSCDSAAANLKQVVKTYTPSVIYSKDSKDDKHRTKKNLGRRRFRGIKRHRADASHTSSLLSPPHSPRSHASQSSGISSMPRTCPSPDLSTDSECESNTKRPRYEVMPYTPEMSIASGATSSSTESYEEKKQRYMKTAAALRQSGLLDITMKTADLLRKNQELQRSIEALQNETRNFVTSVLSNKENRPLLQTITSRAQLYELVVPGSQSIMAVSAIPALSTPATTQPSLEAALEAPPVDPVLTKPSRSQQLDSSGDSSSSSPDQSSPTPNTSSSDPNSDTSLQSDDNES